MAKRIEIAYLDQLSLISADLNVIVYLKTLVQDDKFIGVTKDNEQIEAKKTVDSFILRNELSTASKLTEIVEKICTEVDE